METSTTSTIYSQFCHHRRPKITPSQVRLKAEDVISLQTRSNLRKRKVYFMDSSYFTTKTGGKPRASQQILDILRSQPCDMSRGGRVHIYLETGNDSFYAVSSHSPVLHGFLCNKQESV